jgi:hypothetical protein
VGFDKRHPRHQERPAFQELQHPQPRLTLDHQVVRPFGAGDITHHLAGGADPVKVLGTDIAFLRVALQQEADRLFAACSLLGRRHRSGAADGDRRHHAGEQHRIAHRHDDHCILRQRLERGAVLPRLRCQRGRARAAA